MAARLQRGQATVEWAGTVAAVALLIGALAVWVAGAVDVPERPPDPIGALVAPLAEAPQGLRAGAKAADLAGLAGRASPDAGRRAAAWLGRTSRAAAALGRDMGAAFGTGFADRLRRRLQDLVAHPPAPLELLPEPEALAPGALVRDLVHLSTRDPGAVVDYARSLAGMPPRDAAVRAAGDAGAVTADAAVEAAELLLKRLILRAATRAGGGTGQGGGALT